MKSYSKKPLFYLHCKLCVEQNLEQQLESFANETGMIFIWCKNHNQEVFHTEMPVIDVSQMKCAHCGSEKPHKH